MNFEGKWKLSNGLIAVVQKQRDIGGMHWVGFIRIQDHDIFAMWDNFGHSMYNQPEYSLRAKVRPGSEEA